MTDKRRFPARKSVAAAYLQGQVEAERFEQGRSMEVAMSLLDLRVSPDPTTPLDTQLLAGEGFTVYDEIPEMGLSWGQSERDGYVGYVFTEGLAEKSAAPKTAITALAAIVYVRPDLKSDLMGAYSLGCAVEVVADAGDYAQLHTDAFIPKPYLQPVETTDFVDIAERFLGVPYLWGGRSSYGIDCSALVQIAMQTVGLQAPRDSDMQLAELGAPVKAPLQRGDLVFWKGHVGVMRDGETLLHANAHHMAVASEPLADAQARIAAKGDGDIIGIRRLAR